MKSIRYHLLTNVLPIALLMCLMAMAMISVNLLLI